MERPKIPHYKTLVEATERALAKLTRPEGPELGPKEYWRRVLAYHDITVAKNYPGLYNSYLLKFGQKFSEVFNLTKQ